MIDLDPESEDEEWLKFASAAAAADPLPVPGKLETPDTSEMPSGLSSPQAQSAEEFPALPAPLRPAAQPRRPERHPPDRPDPQIGACWSFAAHLGIVDHGPNHILALPQIWKVFVALDSGAVDHCVNPKELPDSIMVVKEDEKRRFVNATGEDIDH